MDRKGEGLREERTLPIAQAQAVGRSSTSSLLTQFCGFWVLIPWIGGVWDCEAKEGMLPATARSSHVDPGVKHTPGRSLRRCGPSLLPFLFWGAVPAPQAPETSGQLLPISFGQDVSPNAEGAM